MRNFYDLSIPIIDVALTRCIYFIFGNFEGRKKKETVYKSINIKKKKKTPKDGKCNDVRCLLTNKSVTIFRKAVRDAKINMNMFSLHASFFNII